MWPPSMGGLLEEERELSNGWWKANIVGGCGGKWGSLDRELDKSLVAMSRDLVVLSSHKGHRRTGELVVAGL